MRLLKAFNNFPKEQQLVGRMLMAYGEMEFDLASLIGFAIGSDHDTATRILFRVNGEAARIDVADAILRPYFAKAGLEGPWTNTLGAVRYCKNVRNQYAHCHRYGGERLVLMNLDKDADSPEGTLNVNLFPTDLRLLQEQHGYFEYTLDWTFYLDCNCRLRLGETIPGPVPEAPKSIPQPPLHNRPKTATAPQGR